MPGIERDRADLLPDFRDFDAIASFDEVAHKRRVVAERSEHVSVTLLNVDIDPSEGLRGGG